MTRAALLLPGLLFGCLETPAPASLVAVGVVVEDDNNGDGVLSPGESATLRVYVGNEGEESTDYEARCRVTSDSEHVTVLERDDELSFRSCDAGRRCDSTVDVQVAASQPDEFVTFACDVVPAEGAVVNELRFPLLVSPPMVDLAVHTVLVEDDPSGDGVLNPGESATIRVGLRNRGASGITRSACVVGTGTPGVEVLSTDDRLDYSSCGGGEDCGTSDFRVRVEGDPGAVQFACDLVDSQEATWPVQFTLPVLPVAAQPRVDAVTVTDDDALTVDDTSTLRVALQNVGPSRLTRSDCVVTGDEHLEVLSSDERLNYSSCDADAECGTSDIRVRGLASGTATLRCPLQNSEGAEWPLEFTVEVR